ncbi:hypothetical protein E3U47_13250 [Pseudomonas sp. RIT623]|nr:hypothetical protein E3U47_13250 [Pseudomonas sp. RIT623]
MGAGLPANAGITGARQRVTWFASKAGSYSLYTGAAPHSPAAITSIRLPAWAFSSLIATNFEVGV